MALDTEIGDTAAMIKERFRRHRHAEIILSMPGFGVILGAEFIVATGGDMGAFASVDRLAGVSGLAPVSRDSGPISGNLKRPRRYNRRLLRTCYLSAQIAMHRPPLAHRLRPQTRRRQNPHPSRPRPGPSPPACSAAIMSCTTTAVARRSATKPRLARYVITRGLNSDAQQRCTASIRPFVAGDVGDGRVHPGERRVAAILPRR